MLKKVFRFLARVEVGESGKFLIENFGKSCEIYNPEPFLYLLELTALLNINAYV